jgi:hypothetical protein
MLRSKLIEVVRAIAPLVCVAVLLQLTIVQASSELFLQFAIGVLLSIAGMLLLFTGIDIGILPMGRYIGAELPRKKSLLLILGVAFALGFVTTVAEPDVLVLSKEVERASAGAIAHQSLVYVIAIGVGLFVALAVVRIIWEIPMSILLTIAYSASIGLSLLFPELVPLAYDAGSVTTGVMSAPVIIALALGLTAVLGKRSTVSDGFGLLGLASVGPILIVLVIFGLLRR